MFGFPKEFLESLGLDMMMLESLPEEMRIETLSMFDEDYMYWRSARDAQASKSESMQAKQQEKDILL